MQVYTPESATSTALITGGELELWFSVLILPSKPKPESAARSGMAAYSLLQLNSIASSILICGSPLQSNCTVWPGRADRTGGPAMLTAMGRWAQNSPTQPGLHKHTGLPCSPVQLPWSASHGHRCSGTQNSKDTMVELLHNAQSGEAKASLTYHILVVL